MSAQTQKTILVTGGAGYIGSHIALELVQHGHRVIILDLDCSCSRLKDAVYIEGDCGNRVLLTQLFSTYNVDLVMHCAAYIEVGASVHDPLRFYDNNVGKTITLLQTMLDHGIKQFVFSSSAAVYGTPTTPLLSEKHSTNPISPYGHTKRMIEQVLADLTRSHDFRSVIFRYFNAAGAYPDYNLGERHEPETHLIPLVLRAAYTQTPITIFGTDYATPDGTCIRDYVHVRDIAFAHRLALDYLIAGGISDCFNVGTGKGFSVQGIISVVEEVVQKKIQIKVLPSRPGDPSILVADISKIQKKLNWRLLHADLRYIIHSAYKFEAAFVV